MIRFYLVPVVTVVDSRGTHRGPKFFPTPWQTGAPLIDQIVYAVRDYGDDDLMLIAADLDDTQDAALVATGEVTKMADNLDQQIGADLAAVQAALELLNLPAQMLTATVTYRTLLKGINAIMEIAQCMQGLGFNIFAGGVTLSTTLSQLPVAARQALSACAVQFNYDQTGITGASSVRQVFTTIVQQARSFTMMGVTV